MFWFLEEFHVTPPLQMGDDASSSSGYKRLRPGGGWGGWGTTKTQKDVLGSKGWIWNQPVMNHPSHLK